MSNKSDNWRCDNCVHSILNLDLQYVECKLDGEIMLVDECCNFYIEEDL